MALCFPGGGAGSWLQCLSNFLFGCGLHPLLMAPVTLWAAEVRHGSSCTGLRQDVCLKGCVHTRALSTPSEVVMFRVPASIQWRWKTAGSVRVSRRSLSIRCQLIRAGPPRPLLTPPLPSHSVWEQGLQTGGRWGGCISDKCPYS